MNVLITTAIYPPEIGGPATYVPRFAKTLARQGHRVTVLTTSPADGKARPLLEEPSAGDVLVRRVPRRGGRLLWGLRVVWNVLSLGRGSDLIYANGLFAEVYAASFWLRSPVLLKVVGDAAWEAYVAQGGALDIETFQGMSFTLGQRIRRFLQRSWCRKADRIIAASRFFSRHIERWGVPDRKIVVIPNGVEVDGQVSQGPALAARSGAIRLISYGRLLAWKGFDKVIRLAAERPSLSLTLIGSGPEEERLKSLAEELGLGDRARFIPYLPASRIREELSRHHLFVLFSSSETFSYALIEAMAAGLAVVVADRGSLPEIVEHGRNGWVCRWDDPGGLSEAVDRLTADPSLRRRLAQEAHEDARRLYAWEQVAARTVSLMEEVAAARA